MLNALIRAKLASLLLIFKGRNGKNSAGKIILAALLVLYSVGMFIFMFRELFAGLIPAADAIGAGWLTISLYTMIAFSLMVFESIFTTKAHLFEAKDNELLLSMPIPMSYILTSRMVFIYVVNLFTELIILIPLVYCIISIGIVLPVAGWIALVLTALTLPLFATALASVFGALLALITKRARHKEIITIVISVAALAAYMYFYPKLISVNPERFTDMEDVFGRFPPLYWVGNAVWNGDILHLVLTLLVIIVPFVIAFIIISRLLYNVMTDTRGARHIEYKARELHASSALSALLRREFIRLGKTTMYLLNDSFGVLMAVAAGVALLIFSGNVKEVIAQIASAMPAGFVAALLTLAACSLSSMIMLGAPSISLEGKTLWVLRTMPVKPSAIINSKLLLHNVIGQPAILFFVICASLVLRVSFAEAVLCYATAGMFTFIMSATGLLLDLKFPLLEWENETIPVKQNASTILTMLIGFTIIGAPILIVIFLVDNPDFAVIKLLYFAALTVIAAGLYVLLLARGGKLIERIEK